MATKSLPPLSATFILAILLLFPHSYANSDNTAEEQEAQSKALDMINDFIDRFCYNIPLIGMGDRTELSGDAKVELAELNKNIINLNINGESK